MPEWEIIDAATGGGTERLAVPGGWLYRSAWQDARRFIAGASGLAFVPGDSGWVEPVKEAPLLVTGEMVWQDEASGEMLPTSADESETAVETV